MFKNHFRERTGKTPINLAVARIVFSLYLIWKIVSVRLERVYEWGQVPGYQHVNLQNEQPEAYSTEMVVHLEPLIPKIALANVRYIQLTAILFLLLFAFGYRIRFTGFVSSFLITYLGMIHAFVDYAWSTQILPVSGIVLMIFALYADQDALSYDGFRRHSKDGLESLNRQLKRPLTNTYRATPLSLLLLSLGVLYFGSAIGKLIQSGPQWIAPHNLGRQLHDGGGYLPELAALIRQSEILLVAGGVGTLVFELGFILAILSGKFFSVTILGLIAFHIGVALTMGPIFIYTIVLLLLFLDCEKIIANLQTKNQICVVYNEKCVTTSKILYVFKNLDVHRSLQFNTNLGYSHTPETESKDSLYVYCDGRVETGIGAIHQLSKHSVILFPVTFIFTFPILSLIIDKIFDYLTKARRSRKNTATLKSNSSPEDE